jgi:predicted ATP-grasp superfamily ATP-dependent carboligase
MPLMTSSDSTSGIPALVLGESVTALGVVRCLGRKGIRALRPGPHGDYASWSRWSRRLPLELGSPPSPDVLADYLERLPVDRAVVVPCSDDWTRAVAGLPEGVRERFPSTVPSPDAIGVFLDKAEFAALLEREGVPHPRTIVSDDAEALRGWSNES